jgi:hypothetical protein
MGIYSAIPEKKRKQIGKDDESVGYSQGKTGVEVLEDIPPGISDLYYSGHGLVNLSLGRVMFQLWGSL